MGNSEAKYYETPEIHKDVYNPTGDQLMQMKGSGFWEDDEINDEHSGCFSFCRPKRIDTINPYWKVELIEELESMDYPWCKTLLNIVKKWNSPEIDKAFQAEVFFADLSGKGIKIDLTLVLDQNKSAPTFGGRYSQSIDETVNRSDRSMFASDQTIASLVETSALLEEQFFDRMSKDHFMNKLAVKKKRKESSWAIQGPRASRYKTKRRLSPAMKQYRTNTFVNQMQVASGVDTLKITDPEEVMQAIAKYKLITEIIEKHFTNEKSIFCALINSFVEYFTTKYEPPLKRARNNDMKYRELVESIEATVTDCQQLIRILYETISLYYRFQKLSIAKEKHEFLFNRDNLINFITTIILNTRLYDIVFEFITIHESDTEEKYQENLNKCKFKKPEDFGVPEQYCLNKLTIEYLEAKGLINQKYTYEETGNTMQMVILEDSQKSNVKPKISGTPYEEVITTLKQLLYRRSPIHKLKCIVKAAEQVTLCIEEFYKDCGTTNTKKLDGDQTLSIFMYCVVRSELKYLGTHCKIIDKFSTYNILNSISGYYATTLEACLACISGMKVDAGMTQEEVTQTLRVKVMEVSRDDEADDGNNYIPPSPMNVEYNKMAQLSE